MRSSKTRRGSPWSVPSAEQRGRFHSAAIRRMPCTPGSAPRSNRVTLLQTKVTVGFAARRATALARAILVARQRARARRAGRAGRDHHGVIAVWGIPPLTFLSRLHSVRLDHQKAQPLRSLRPTVWIKLHQPAHQQVYCCNAAGSRCISRPSLRAAQRGYDVPQSGCRITFPLKSFASARIAAAISLASGRRNKR